MPARGGARHRGERGSQLMDERYDCCAHCWWRSPSGRARIATVRPRVINSMTSGVALAIGASGDRNSCGSALHRVGSAWSSPIDASEQRNPFWLRKNSQDVGGGAHGSWSLTITRLLPLAKPGSQLVSGSDQPPLPRGRLASLPASLAQLRALCRNPVAVPRPGQRSFP